MQSHVSKNSRRGQVLPVGSWWHINCRHGGEGCRIWQQDNKLSNTQMVIPSGGEMIRQFRPVTISRCEVSDLSGKVDILLNAVCRTYTAISCKGSKLKEEKE